jgi:hypothetical protein
VGRLAQVLSFAGRDTGSDRADQIVGVRLVEPESGLENASFVPTILVMGIEAIAGELGQLDDRNVPISQDRRDVDSWT